MDSRSNADQGPLGGIVRTAEFWRRAVGIYAGYKAAQGRAAILEMTGKNRDVLETTLWEPHHRWAGKEMYKLCVDLRGFYLKAGQFIGARGDFVPMMVAKELSKLHDQVPPMPRERAEALLKKELKVADLAEVFSDIDLDKPLGSASIAQVHKAHLRPVLSSDKYSNVMAKANKFQEYKVVQNEDIWCICNKNGLSLEQIQAANPGANLGSLSTGQTVKIPMSEVNGSAVASAARAMLGKNAPKNGAVAVKIQYPDALATMKKDLGNVRSWASFLSKTEIKFDMVSAVDELERQIELEFDFTREARVMDSVAQSLQKISSRVVVPRSIPGLVTNRVLVMHFMEGVPLRELGSRTKNLSERKKRIAKEMILSRISEAYGRMILEDGLFQADGHPGNILVQEGAKIALLDYGQSKQLGIEQRLLFAKLIVAMSRENKKEVSEALDDLGVVTELDDWAIRGRMATGMFDTKGKVDPFDKDSPIKQCAITTFPADFFFVLRVVQLIRGLKQGMDVKDFSSAEQWKPYAEQAVRELSS